MDADSDDEGGAPRRAGIEVAMIAAMACYVLCNAGREGNVTIFQFGLSSRYGQFLIEAIASWKP